MKRIRILLLALWLIGCGAAKNSSQTSELRPLSGQSFKEPVGGYFDFAGTEVASNVKIAQGSEHYFDQQKLFPYLEYMGLVDNGIHYVIFVDRTRDGAPGLTDRVTLNDNFTGAVHMTCDSAFSNEPGGLWGCFINEFRDGRTVAEVNYDQTSIKERDSVSWAWDAAVTAYVEEQCADWDCYKSYLRNVVQRQGFDFIPISETTYLEFINLIQEQDSFLK